MNDEPIVKMKTQHINIAIAAVCFLAVSVVAIWDLNGHLKRDHDKKPMRILKVRIDPEVVQFDGLPGVEDGYTLDIQIVGAELKYGGFIRTHGWWENGSYYGGSIPSIYISGWKTNSMSDLRSKPVDQQ